MSKSQPFLSEHREIATNKQYTIEQMNLVHKTLDAFEKDFVNRL